MYRCNDCNEFFSEAETIEEYHPYGMGRATEYRAVCPGCSGTSFDEVRERKSDDAFLSIKKSEAVDYVVEAIGLINSGDTDAAKETLIEFIGEMVDSPFEYKKSLAVVSGKEAAEELIAEIQTMLEVEVV